MTKIKRHLKWILAGLGLVLLLSVSIRFEKLDQRQAKLKGNQFDAAGYARDFWDHRLPKVLEQSSDAFSLIQLFNNDMQRAIQEGQTLGESRVHAYLLQDTGTVVALDKGGVLLKLTRSQDSGPAIRLVTRLFVSGNAIRDASGLVNVSDFSDTMKFNKISSHINKIVVTEVIKPFLAQMPEIGQEVTFFGATEVAEDATEQVAFGRSDEQGNVNQLSVIPIRLELQ